MKNIALILTTLITLGLFGCQQKEQVIEKPESLTLENPSNKAEVSEDNFIYRLVTVKDHYEEGESVKIYAELEYIGKEDEVEINHGTSPFFFPMTETTRNYEIEYAVTLPGKSAILKKSEPMRQESSGGGGYSDHDNEEYKDFMKLVMKQNYPNGHYIVDGYANFTLGDEDESEYTMAAQIEFYVD